MQRATGSRAAPSLQDQSRDQLAALRSRSERGSRCYTRKQEGPKGAKHDGSSGAEAQPERSLTITVS